MPTAVIADVHANLAALEAVIADIDRQGSGEILCLGDMIGYGPDPEEVLTLLRQRQAVMIMGNHEQALVRPVATRMNPDPRRSLEITRELLSAGTLSSLGGLEPVLVHREVRLVHGCPPRSPTCYLLYAPAATLTRIFGSFPEKLCFYGHTHIPCLLAEGRPPEEIWEPELRTYFLEPGRRYLINPGSVGQPRDQLSRKAKYLVWDRAAGTVTFREVAYDVMRTVRRLRLLNFPSFNSERLLDRKT